MKPGRVLETQGLQDW